MFKTLLWKEWRETRFFLFIMTTGVLLVSLILKSLEQNGNDILASLYVIIWVFFAVLLAASQFSNEAESGTLDFLLSRPTHWFNIWLIKTLYGICALTVFSFFLLLVGYLFIPSLTESASGFQFFLKNTPSSTPLPIPFIGMVLFTIIFWLYFAGCIVSTNLKSSLKAALVTFLVSGLLYFIMLSSSLLLNFTSSNYIFWIIFPALFFVVFLKYQSSFYFKRVSYWTLSIGGTFFWIIFALKGTSLLLLFTFPRRSLIFNLCPSYVLFSLLLISFVISSILTSIFAFGIRRKKYPVWWKSISCFNLLIIFTICTTAILFEAIPSQEDNRATNSLSSIFIHHDRYFKIPLRYKDIFPYKKERVSRQYSIFNENNGEVHSLGHGKFIFNKGFPNVSIESRWAFYSCPALRWGVYYKWGLWAENLLTNRQYLLMTRNNIPTMDDIEEKWFDKGSHLIILDRDSNKKTLFSVKNGIPQKIKEEQEPGKSWLLHIDTNNKLYFYNSMNGIISCYNHELIKEYELSVVKDKMIEIISDYFQNEDSNHNKDRTDIDFDNFTVGRDGRVKPNRDYIMPDIYFIGPYFSISPDGKYMIFHLSLNSKAGELKTDEPENWCVSLPDGIYNKEVKLRNTYPDSYHWIPGTGRVLDSYRKGNNVDLIDFNKGIRKNIIKGNFYYIQRKFPIESSDNGTYILTYSSSNTLFRKTVSLYRLDSDTLTCSLVSSKADLEHEVHGTLQRWSSDRSQVVFRDSDSGNIWRMDLNKGEWSEIKCPFENFRLLGVNNKGEVYVNPSSSAKTIRIYRLTETDSKIIFEG